MCDIERPMSWFGHILNLPYKWLMSVTVVPNTDEDKKGFANRVFSSTAPLLEKTKRLKETNLFAYKIIKYTVNTTILLMIAGLIWLIIKFIIWLI
jgi:beta-hydroxylase